ncbi:MAG: siphovirus ReqiPepy6 Gp37-like family protein [Acutalibacteraceae bacterium]|nr:siphovirus ReqiPepy6 Gp37-like family protein [Acutalibacteraceae bacterium]
MEYPSIKVLSPVFDLLCEIDTYTSLRFKRSWQSYGEFELHIIGYNNCLQPNNYIMVGNDENKVGIIKCIHTSAGTNGYSTIVKGYHLNGITTQRIVLPYEDKANHGYFCVPKQVENVETKQVSAETILKAFTRACFPSDTTNPRNINLYIPADEQRGMKTVWLSRYEQLDEVLQKVCEYTDVGYRVYIDLINKRLTFDILTGIDRSASQTTNSRVIMSENFESINNLEWIFDKTKEKNVAYAGGIGEDENRLVLAITNENEMPHGLARTEVFVDCGTLEATETEETLSLSDEAKHKLLDYKSQESLTAENNLSGTYIYGKHYDLGDLVTVVDIHNNKSEDKRITEVEECYEAKSVSIKLTFGTAPDHLHRVIKSFLPTVK